jgi:uncharacterized membrane protein
LINAQLAMMMWKLMDLVACLLLPGHFMIPIFVFSISGSISNIDGDECSCSKSHVRKVISGVVGAASSVTSIQVANLLRLFRIPQVKIHVDFQGPLNV